MGSADNGEGLIECLLFEDDSSAKVDQYELSLPVDHRILRFEISIDDILQVEIL